MFSWVVGVRAQHDPKRSQDIFGWRGSGTTEAKETEGVTSKFKPCGLQLSSRNNMTYFRDNLEG